LLNARIKQNYPTFRGFNHTLFFKRWVRSACSRYRVCSAKK